MKILIVKTSALGDIIHAFPLVTFLKNVYPEATINWVVEAPFAELVKAHPEIERTLPIQTKKWRQHLFSGETLKQIRAFYRELRQVEYDVVFDLQGNTKSAFVTAGARARVKVGFDRKSVAEWPNLCVTNRRYQPPQGRNIRLDYLYLAERYAGVEADAPMNSSSVELRIKETESGAIDKLLHQPQIAGKKTLLVCPGSAWKNKQMSREDLLEWLRDIVIKNVDSFFLLAWGNEAEKEYCHYLREQLPPESACVIDRLSLPALQVLMGRVSRVIAMDSLPLHLAGTTSTPTWSVFGPSSGSKYAPLGEQHTFYQGVCPYGRQFEKRCPVLRTCPTGACMKVNRPSLTEVAVDAVCGADQA